MEVIVPHGVLTSGFGLAVEDGAIFAISPCCGQEIRVQHSSPARVFCVSCEEDYREWGRDRSVNPGFTSLVTSIKNHDWQLELVQGWFRKMSEEPTLILEVS